MPSWNPVDLALTTNKMPKGFPDSSMFRLAVQTDAKGLAIGQCTVRAARKLTGEVAELLCRETAAEPLIPAMDERGDAVPSVQEFIVRLTSQPGLDRFMKRLRRR